MTDGLVNDTPYQGNNNSSSLRVALTIVYVFITLEPHKRKKKQTEPHWVCFIQPYTHF